MCNVKLVKSFLCKIYRKVWKINVFNFTLTLNIYKTISWEFASEIGEKEFFNLVKNYGLEIN